MFSKVLPLGLGALWTVFAALVLSYMATCSNRRARSSAPVEPFCTLKADYCGMLTR
ncbi:hypothetical protein B0H14DRAFT_3436204 [Mycena olivaceomarginata]|nr:hypothetical protein B0H14DRAFT_3436204 [Mycena olivaceomarginata]